MFVNKVIFSFNRYFDMNCESCTCLNEMVLGHFGHFSDYSSFQSLFGVLDIFIHLSVNCVSHLKIKRTEIWRPNIEGYVIMKFSSVHSCVIKIMCNNLEFYFNTCCLLLHTLSIQDSTSRTLMKAVEAFLKEVRRHHYMSFIIENY